MNKFDVLIVEDELRIAELHAQFIRQHSRFNPVGIASTQAETRRMIRVLKPDLILLDNFMPDGLGIDLMREMLSDKNAPDVIFITAASDIETVREAVRCGTFDYLLKPIGYDRLQDTLQRYLRYRSSINAGDNVNQRHVDEMFNLQAREMTYRNLPKGIDELTLDKVKNAFISAEVFHTAESLGELIGISKTTARRYLEHCAALSFVYAEVMHGKVGRPERVYRRHG
jgi:two-component system response regulator CitB